MKVIILNKKRTEETKLFSPTLVGLPENGRVLAC